MRMKMVLLALLAFGTTWLAAGGAAQDQQPEPPKEAAKKKAGTKVDWPAKMETDWNDLHIYRDKNKQVKPPAPDEERVIFLGDSITENWGKSLAKYFPGKPYINRGYTSETSQQMLIRFRPDVINLKPKAVVILAGCNDVAGNTGRQELDQIEGNILSMLDLAAYNNIKVVLLSTLPADRYFWQPSIKDSAEKIVALNALLKEDVKDRKGIIYVDCHTPMKDDKNAMKKEYSFDGVHPTAAGFQVMSKLTADAIAQILKQ